MSDTKIIQIKSLKDKFKAYGSSLSNWGILMMENLDATKEVVVCGNKSTQVLEELNRLYSPNVTWVASDIINENIPLLKDRFSPEKTLIYVCINNTCQLPTADIDKAKKMILEN